MAIALAVATACILLAVLVGFGYYTTVTQQTRERSALRQLCAALYPDFTWPHAGRDTTQTFRLMLAGMAVFGAVLVLWSIGAGTLRAVYLLSSDAVHSTWLAEAKCTKDSCNWQVWLFTSFQIIRAVGGVTLLCLAGGLVGGFLGFLFGIPRRVSADGAAAAAAQPADSKTPSSSKATAAYELSTNLTQVSDWLTKVIIGVSLVQAQSAYSGYITISQTTALWLFESRHGSPVVLGAALAGGAVFGFLFFYLYTQLVLSRLIAAAERALGALQGATERLRSIAAKARQLVPPIRRTAHPNDEVVPPSAEELEAAMAYYAIPFDELIANPNATDEEILSWARARCLLNDYRSAVPAYFYLLARSME
jgi:hypothetical protein